MSDKTYWNPVKNPDKLMKMDSPAMSGLGYWNPVI
jgi:hypothetical protein